MTIQLEQLRIASPCQVSWDSMTGDERSRFCGQCQLKVHNISGMTREAAEAFLSESTGRVCIRMYKRFDGTVITTDCPVGKETIRNRLLCLCGSILAIALMGAANLWSSMSGKRSNAFVTQLQHRVTSSSGVLMGAYCPPTPVPAVPVLPTTITVPVGSEE
jgi:hypothetical protein